MQVMRLFSAHLLKVGAHTLTTEDVRMRMVTTTDVVTS